MEKMTHAPPVIQHSSQNHHHHRGDGGSVGFHSGRHQNYPNTRAILTLPLHHNTRIAAVQQPVLSSSMGQIITPFNPPIAPFPPLIEPSTKIIKVPPSKASRRSSAPTPSSSSFVSQSHPTDPTFSKPPRPLAVSWWDGSVVQSHSSLSSDYSLSVTTPKERDDVVTTMMRRAEGLYGTGVSNNLSLLSKEKYYFEDDDKLWYLWSWIERVAYLSDGRGLVGENGFWSDRGLMDVGVKTITKMNNGYKGAYRSGSCDFVGKSNAGFSDEVVTMSEILGCNSYESPIRQYAIEACGWGSTGDISSILSDCEANGHFERSAALAVFHGEFDNAVSALRRAASLCSTHEDNTPGVEDESSTSYKSKHKFYSNQYAKTLHRVAEYITRYAKNKSKLWRVACNPLLQRKLFQEKNAHVAYLRAACVFLSNIGENDGFDKILFDKNLILSDRVAFACRFLTQNELRSYLDTSVEHCLVAGDIEGLVITGMNKRGVAVLQAYVDRTSDVQTAALVSCRVVLPVTWHTERAACAEWLDSYRQLLNAWQMWKQRALFDVGRANLLRSSKQPKKIRTDGTSLMVKQQQQSISTHKSLRGLQQHKNKMQVRPMPSIANKNLMQQFPSQLHARCNYCNIALPLSILRQREEMANSWLSSQKSVLSCCPGCKKPLPRCAICHLNLTCLNPYPELKRERDNGGAAAAMNGASSSGAGTGDLSKLPNLPFEEWFTWCVKCKHGGHAHHMLRWFETHDVCPVSQCDCQCWHGGGDKVRKRIQGDNGARGTDG